MEDDSLKWGELTVFLKFMQTYCGRPFLCVDGHVSVTCVWTAIGVWTAISRSVRAHSLSTWLKMDEMDEPFGEKMDPHVLVMILVQTCSLEAF